MLEEGLKSENGKEDVFYYGGDLKSEINKWDKNVDQIAELVDKYKILKQIRLDADLNS